jgi:hypothetical protein
LPFNIVLEGSAEDLDAIDTPVRDALQSFMLTGVSEQFDTLETIVLFEEPSEDTGAATTRSYAFSGFAEFTDDGNVPTEAEVQEIQRQLLDENADQIVKFLEDDDIFVSVKDISFDTDNGSSGSTSSPTSSPTSPSSVQRALLPFNIVLEGSAEDLDAIDTPVKQSLQSFMLTGVSEQFDTLETIVLFEELSEDTGVATTRSFSFSGFAEFSDDGNVPTEAEVQEIQRQLLLDALQNENADEITKLLEDNDLFVNFKDISFDTENGDHLINISGGSNDFGVKASTMVLVTFGVYAFA